MPHGSIIVALVITAVALWTRLYKINWAAYVVWYGLLLLSSIHCLYSYNSLTILCIFIQGRSTFWVCLVLFMSCTVHVLSVFNVLIQRFIIENSLGIISKERFISMSIHHLGKC